MEIKKLIQNFCSQFKLINFLLIFLFQEILCSETYSNKFALCLKDRFDKKIYIRQFDQFPNEIFIERLLNNHKRIFDGDIAKIKLNSKITLKDATIYDDEIYILIQDSSGYAVIVFDNNLNEKKYIKRCKRASGVPQKITVKNNKIWIKVVEESNENTKITIHCIPLDFL